MPTAPHDLLTSPPWHELAACRGSDPQLFFPPDELPAPLRVQLQQQAAAVCRPCPVRQACLGYSLLTGQRHGVWGGLPAAALPAAVPQAGELDVWACENCSTPNRRKRRRCADCGTSRD